MSQDSTGAPTGEGAPRRKIGRPFQPGQSGNPSGRPKIEPRIRRRARRYDSRVVAELFKIGTDPKVDADTRRKCLMDLQAIGNGKPVTSQELVRPETPQAPLAVFNFGKQSGAPLTPDQAYRLMIDGTIPADGAHPAFHRRQPVTVTAEPVSDANAQPVNSAAPEPSGEATEGNTDQRVEPRSDLRDIVERLNR